MTAILPRRLIAQTTDSNGVPVTDDFGTRVMTSFESDRLSQFNNFQNDVEEFLRILENRTIEVNGKSAVSAHQIWKTVMENESIASEDVQQLFSRKNVMNLTKVDRKLDGIISWQNIVQFTTNYLLNESYYLRLLPYSTNHLNVTPLQLRHFVENEVLIGWGEDVSMPANHVDYLTQAIIFLLDARNKEMILIEDIMASNVFVQLKKTMDYDRQKTDTPPENHLFAIETGKRAIDEFLEVDFDRTSVVTQSKLTVFKNANFNTYFLKRVLEVNARFEKDSMDFCGFVNLFAAVEMRHTKASLRYHFEIFDRDGDGVIDRADLELFIMNMNEYIEVNRTVEFQVPDRQLFASELFDMLGCKETERITMDIFFNHRLSPMFCGAITDLNGFIDYETRF